MASADVTSVTKHLYCPGLWGIAVVKFSCFVKEHEINVFHICSCGQVSLCAVYEG